MQDLFGSSGSSSTQANQSGFSLLPQQIQQGFTNIATQGQQTLAPQGGSPNASLFTLPSMPAASGSALSQIQNQDFNITPQSISSDINEQMNPYNQSVINQIEQAQNGQESQLSQYLTQAGQFGSNRGMLGASDISEQAANQIGSFLGGEYNTSLQNALTTIPQAAANSAANSVQAGQLSQQQGLQNQTAPVSALAALAQLFGIEPSNTSATGSSTTSQSQGPIL